MSSKPHLLTAPLLQHNRYTCASFGFLDGISQPAVKDFDTKPNPGQETVPQGAILCGREGDVVAGTATPFTRPAWALDGSFLALRYLFQLVPEFDNFLKASADPTKGFTSDLLGARLVGRWKSGMQALLAAQFRYAHQTGFRCSRRRLSLGRQPRRWKGPPSEQQL